MTTISGSTPYHLADQQGPALWHLGGLLTFKATTENTDARLWVLEALGERGYATPVHRHTREDEAFYVLDGEVSFYVGDNVIRAERGSFLWGPRDVPHAYCIESDQARFLSFATTGGFDTFFFETGEPAAALTVPPPPGGPPDHDELVRVLTRHGVEMVGPPPAPRSS